MSRSLSRYFEKQIPSQYNLKEEKYILESLKVTRCFVPAIIKINIKFNSSCEQSDKDIQVTINFDMTTMDENWSYQLNINAIEESNFSTFESQIFELRDHILKLIDKGFTLEHYKNHDGIAQNFDDDLRNFIENNKDLRQEIEMKVKDLHQQQTRYKTFKHDQKLLSQEIKEKHEAFLMAKKFYKNHLKMYYTTESKIDKKQKIYVQFFTEVKKESDTYSVCLLENLETGKYELLSTNPKLKNLKELQRKLQEFNDTPGALCCIRDHFLSVKKVK